MATTDAENESAKALEDKFEKAENDFEILSGGALDAVDARGPHNSPSDLLWSQMKRQLNMREHLRSKKQELEELIRDENGAAQRSGGACEGEENGEENRLVSCYRGLLLKNKREHEEQANVAGVGAGGVEGEERAEEDEDEEEIIMKRYVHLLVEYGRRLFFSEACQCVTIYGLFCEVVCLGYLHKLA